MANWYDNAFMGVAGRTFAEMSGALSRGGGQTRNVDDEIDERVRTDKALIESRYDLNRQQEEETAKRRAATEDRLVTELSADDTGALSVARFVLDSDQAVRRMGAMAISGDYAGAKSLYDDFRKVISDNLSDIVSYTRKDVRESGALGADLAQKAAVLLTGSFNGQELEMPDGSRTTLAGVLGDDSSYEGFKRKSFEGLGLNAAVGDVYFGKHGDVAQSVMKNLLDPFVRLGGASMDSVPDRIQRTDLARFLTQQDENGDLALKRLQGLFGTGLGTVIDSVLETHKDAGSYAAVTGTLADIAEAIRDSGVDIGPDLASKTMSVYNRSFDAAFVGLDDRTKLLPRYRVLFDAALKKTFTRLQQKNLSVDLDNPALATGFRRMVDQIVWGDMLGIDVVGAAADGGVSYLDSAADVIAESTVGETPPGFFNEYDSLRAGLSGIKGARNPTSRSATVRSETGDGPRGTLSQSSELTGLDGVAVGFQKAVTEAVIPGLRNGMTLGQAIEALENDDKSYDQLINSIALQVRKFIPLDRSNEISNTLADTMWESWKRSGGTAMTVEDCVDFVLEGTAPDGSPRSWLSQEAETGLRIWAAANIDTDPRKTEWRELFSKHYASEHPDDPDRVAQRTAAAMAEVERAIIRGEDPEAVVDAKLSFGKYYRETPIVDEATGAQTTRPWLFGPDGNPRTTQIVLDSGDLKQVAALSGLTLDEFYQQQAALALQAKEDARSFREYSLKLAGARARAAGLETDDY